MQCSVYKSLAKADTYLYLRQRDGFDVLPEPLRQRLGALEWVMDLDLHPERRLARESAPVVLQALETLGFHLQLPPPDPALANAGA